MYVARCVRKRTALLGSHSTSSCVCTHVPPCTESKDTYHSSSSTSLRKWDVVGAIHADMFYITRQWHRAQTRKPAVIVRSLEGGSWLEAAMARSICALHRGTHLRSGSKSGLRFLDKGQPSLMRFSTLDALAILPVLEAYHGEVPRPQLSCVGRPQRGRTIEATADVHSSK